MMLPMSLSTITDAKNALNRLTEVGPIVKVLLRHFLVLTVHTSRSSWPKSARPLSKSTARPSTPSPSKMPISSGSRLRPTPPRSRKRKPRSSLRRRKPTPRRRRRRRKRRSSARKPPRRSSSSPRTTRRSTRKSRRTAARRLPTFPTRTRSARRALRTILPRRRWSPCSSAA